MGAILKWQNTQKLISILIMYLLADLASTKTRGAILPDHASGLVLRTTIGGFKLETASGSGVRPPGLQKWAMTQGIRICMHMQARGPVCGVLTNVQLGGHSREVRRVCFKGLGEGRS